MAIPEVFRKYYDGRTVNYDNVPRYPLLAHVDLKNFGGNGFQVADVNGDGRPEFITRQSSKFVGPGQEYFDTADCLTVFDAGGNILWQKGTPWAHDFEYITHGGLPFMAVDLDHSGRADVFYKAKGSDVLEVLAGATGEPKGVVNLGDPKLTLLNTFFPVPGEPGLLVARDHEGAYRESQSMYFFDSKFQKIAGPMTAVGGGHSGCPVLRCDDGEYALVNGFAAWNRRGEIVWRAKDTYSTDPLAHPDAITCGDIDGDGREEIVYCFEAREDGDWVIVLDRDGNLLWRARSTHPQTTTLARVRKGQPPDVHVSQKFGGMYCLDGDGHMLWERQDIWAYATLVPGSGPLDMVVWKPHRMESVVPFTTDTRGRLNGTFGELLERDQRLLKIPDLLKWAPDMDPAKMPGYWYNRSGDWGVGYSATAADVDGDGRYELLIHDRHDLWIYRLKGAS